MDADSEDSLFIDFEVGDVTGKRSHEFVLRIFIHDIMV
jgi:hypothetical protein